MKIQVKDFMISPVTAAEGTMSVGEIRELMQRKGIHCVPIVYQVDDGVEIRGIISTSDLCCQMDDNVPLEEAVRFTRVFVVSPKASAKSAAEMMLKHHVHHIVVMDDGKLVGMISSLDFVKLVAEFELNKKTDKVL